MRHGDDIARCGVEGDTSWALTASGEKIVFLTPEVGAINLLDIARHLSRLCRFTGAPSQFYSVAQHSILVGQLVKAELDKGPDDVKTVAYWDQILAALLHDAEEFMTGDMSSPLKAAIGGKYVWIAAGIRRKIYERFGVDWEYHNAIVKAGDNKALLIERFYLMPDHGGWPKLSKEEMEYTMPRFMNCDDAMWAYKRIVESCLGYRDAAILELEC